MGIRSSTITGFLTLAFVCIGFALQGQILTLNYFNASPDGSDVLVSFELPHESGVTTFKLYRKIDQESQWTFLDHIAPTGDLRYQYLDYTIFKDEARNITYKLLVYQGGSVYTYYTNILHNPTSVQRTWGSIKAMFK